MKNFIMVSILAGLASTAMASDVYVATTIGQTTLHKINTQSLGLDSFDKKDQGVAVAIGTTVVPHFDIELGYNKFGSFEGVLHGQKFNVKGKAIQASMIGSFEVQPNMNAFLRVGVTQTRAQTMGLSEKKSSLLYGLGTSYQINDRVEGTAEYQYTPKVAFTNKAMSSLHLGVKYRF